MSFRGTISASFFMSVQDNLNRILWNKRHIMIPDDIQVPPGVTYVVIKDTTLEDRNIYAFIKDMEIRLARQSGVSTEDEIFLQARNAGIWTPDDDLVLKKGDEHIAFLESEKEYQKSQSVRKSLQTQIDKTKNKKKNVEDKRAGLYVNSAEYYAHEVATYALLRRVILDSEFKPFFTDDSFTEFKRNYPTFGHFLVNEMMSEGLLPSDKLREIARSPEWRLIWTLQRENVTSLFSRQLGDLNLSQRLLVYWSRVYDSAYEAQEPPSQEVINDDIKFDEWLSHRESNKQESRKETSDHQENMQTLDGEFRETCTCGVKAKNIGKGLGEKLPHSNECLYGTYRHYTSKEKEDRAKQIYSRNSDTIRKLLDREQNTIDDSGIIEEQNLRKEKTRHMLGMKTHTTTTYL